MLATEPGGGSSSAEPGQGSGNLSPGPRDPGNVIISVTVTIIDEIGLINVLLTSEMLGGSSSADLEEGSVWMKISPIIIINHFHCQAQVLCRSRSCEGYGEGQVRGRCESRRSERSKILS